MLAFSAARRSIRRLCCVSKMRSTGSPGRVRLAASMPCGRARKRVWLPSRLGRKDAVDEFLADDPATRSSTSICLQIRRGRPVRRRPRSGTEEDCRPACGGRRGARYQRPSRSATASAYLGRSNRRSGRYRSAPAMARLGIRRNLSCRPSGLMDRKRQCRRSLFPTN